MSRSRAIALVSPHAWPAHDDLTWRVAAEAQALARRGHRVSILTPATGADLLADGRRRLARLRDGDMSAVVAEAGEVLVVPLGRALPAGPRRRIGGPLDLAAALEDVLSRVPFDVVHVHEPLAPSPALAALRHARGVTAATFYRPEQLAGVAFVQPLLERAMGRLDVWVAGGDAARRAVQELFGRDCVVIPGGVDTDRFRPRVPEGTGPPGLVAVARGADRAGLRFALNVLRGLDAAAIGPVTLLAPREAPWRSRAAVPKALRDHVRVIPDTGPDARAEAFAAAEIAILSAPDDLTGSAAAEAMACGLATIVPRVPDAEGLLTHGVDGLALAPFSRDTWVAAIRDLAADPARRADLGRGAVARAARRDWDAVAAELDDVYGAGTAAAPLAPDAASGRILADLCVRTGPGLTAREVVDGAIARGLGAVAVIDTGGVEAGVEAARMARSRLVVIPGQHVHTADGAIVGLFLSEPLADGQRFEDAAAEIRRRGGVVMIPHPSWSEPPSRDLLRRHRGLVDCFEALSGPALTGRASAGEDAARLAQRYGMLATAGSGATSAEDLGAAHLRMRPFGSAHEFLDALVDAEPVQRRRGLRVRALRERRSPATPTT